MTRPQTPPLDTGATFPDLEVSILGGDPLRVPGGFEGRWTVLLGYRGHW